MRVVSLDHWGAYIHFPEAIDSNILGEEIVPAHDDGSDDGRIRWNDNFPNNSQAGRNFVVCHYGEHDGFDFHWIQNPGYKR